MAIQRYNLSEHDRDEVQKLIRQANRQPPEGNDPPLGGPDFEEQPTPHIYLARAPEEGIPALSENTTGTGTVDDEGLWDDVVSFGECDLYEAVEQDDGTMVLHPIDGFSELVYNYTTCAVAPFQWILAVRDKLGTWWAVDPCGAASATSSTTTTSTTTPHGCGGDCRWQCTQVGTGSGTGAGVVYQWELIDYNCYITSGTGTGHYTGTGTAGIPECNCLEPSYCCGVCGNTQEETVTGCTSATPVPQPDCDPDRYTTTTTSTSTSTSTTPGGPLGGCDGCFWMCLGGVWISQEQSCSGDCSPCLEPSEPCDSDCALAYTLCEPLGTTLPTCECTGDCDWISDGEVWISFDTSHCLGATGVTCTCSYPSFTPGACGDELTTPCVVVDCELLGTDNTTLPRPTTTTPIGCTGDCRWTWTFSDDGEWRFSCTNCPQGCFCLNRPYYDGQVEGETAVTVCATTTTTTTTTTSTTTTTTTTEPACGGGCEWYCFMGQWMGISGNCYGTDPECTCGTEPPRIPCDILGDFVVSVGCFNTTTTSTTTTTTTTISPTTTTSTTTTTTTTTTPYWCVEIRDCDFTNGDNCNAGTCSGDPVLGCAAFSFFNPCHFNQGTGATSQWTVLSGPYDTYQECVDSPCVTGGGEYYCWLCIAGTVHHCSQSNPGGDCVSVGGPYADCATCQADCTSADCI